jgi:DNA-binding transcriptional LysR family regulator
MVTELDPAAAPNALRRNEVDVALVHEYDCVPGITAPGLEVEPLLEETVYLASGPLSGRLSDPLPGGLPGPVTEDPILLGRERRWIVGSPDTLCYSMALRLCEAAGFTPDIRHHADDFATVLALVAAGQGVAVVPRLGAVDPPEGVVLTPLAARRRTGIAVRPGRRGDPAVAAFSAAIRTSARDWFGRCDDARREHASAP